MVPGEHRLSVRDQTQGRFPIAEEPGDLLF
jgi:hypothetical protein